MSRISVPASIARRVELAAVRRQLARHPNVGRALAAVLALGAGAGVHSRLAAADAARARWQLSAPVLVAGTAIDPGAPIGPGDVRAVALPLAAVPAGSFAELPTGLVATDPIAPGEVILGHHTSVGALPAALLPPGTAGVAVPAGTTSWSPRVGDEVMVLATDDPLGLDMSGTTGAARTVCESALVVATTDQAVLLGVPDAAVPAVAAAANGGRAVLVLRRVPPPRVTESTP